MSKPRITIGIVLYKKTQYLRECLRSLLCQSFTDFELLLLDHDPELEASRYLREQFPEVLADERVQLLSGTGNHSQGHNRFIAQMQGEIYVCASGDMTYAPDFLGQIVQKLDANPQFGFAGVKLLRWDFERNVCTRTIDSVGLSVTRAQGFFDRGQGRSDEGQYPTREVFGASGALLVLRKSVLAKFAPEVFDADLHYKNDADLCYRLRWAGEKCLYIAEAVAWHDRQLGEKKRTEKNLSQREDSYFGQKVVFFKNFSEEFSWEVRFLAKLRMVLLWIYVHVLERGILSAEARFAKNRERFAEKRAKIKREVLPSELEKYFV